MHSDNFPINGPIPQQKANKIAFHLNTGDFKVSNGRLAQSDDVGHKVLSQESKIKSQDSVDHWINISLLALFNGYEIKETLNENESALLCSLMLD
jgi:hypothetical protein